MNNRLNRKQYSIRLVLSFILVTLLAFILTFLFPFLQPHSFDKGFTLLYFIFYIPNCFIAALFAIKRLHDFNASGWWVAFFIIPQLYFILLILTLFIKGTSGDNKYGPQPGNEY